MGDPAVTCRASERLLSSWCQDDSNVSPRFMRARSCKPHHRTRLTSSTNDTDDTDETNDKLRAENKGSRRPVRRVQSNDNLKYSEKIEKKQPMDLVPHMSHESNVLPKAQTPEKKEKQDLSDLTKGSSKKCQNKSPLTEVTKTRAGVHIVFDTYPKLTLFIIVLTVIIFAVGFAGGWIGCLVGCKKFYQTETKWLYKLWPF